ncbi:MAG TPA: hypothetical protein VFS43_09840 [Polyangiaceae bacterium]|nr:hypothetical protein [Polyangiaceae bacterium]
MTTEKEPHDRSAIATCGVQPKDVEGIINIDNTPFIKDAMSPEAVAFREAQKRDVYPHQEMFGEHCTIMEYIECPVEMAYDYVSNIYSLEEYAVTLRDFRHLGGGVYRGIDYSGPAPIYMRIEAHPGPRTVDHLCAWDQGIDLWMRYYYRFIDAKLAMNKPGTVMLWTNFRHTYYSSDSPAPPYIDEARKRTDRPWVGAYWDIFYPAHKIEAQNLKKILEARFRAYEASRPVR